jgi:hypothetical protein
MFKVYEPRNFDPREFVSPVTYQLMLARLKSPLLVMDVRMLVTADAIRTYFGKPVTINDWHVGGKRQYSGYREPTCQVGELYSQHRFGRALDLLVQGMTAAVVRAEILVNPEAFPFITAMEDGVGWVHVDCRPVVAFGPEKIFLFKGMTSGY